MPNEESQRRSPRSSFKRKKEDALQSGDFSQDKAPCTSSPKTLASGKTIWRDRGSYLESENGVKIDKPDLPLLLNKTVTVDVYAQIMDGRVKRRLHTMFCPAPKGMFTDHENRDKLDNRRMNLRLATISESNVNRPFNGPKTSKFRGVSKWVQRCFGGKYVYVWWRATCSWGRKQHDFGRYKTEIEAARAYNENIQSVHGEFAQFNDIPDQ